MRSGRTLAFVVLALLVGGIVSQLPSALADDSENPFSAMWDAIFDLQSRDDDLQAQIDELRAERNALLAQTGEPVLVSDLYAELEVETTEDGHTLVYVTAGNDGSDRAAGVKLTTFYLMPLFEINSISGDQCEDKSRGIIECVLGTLEEDQESVITIDATARKSGEANTWTVDISTTTEDSDYANNHATYNFETGSGEPIEIPEVVQPEEEQIIEDEISEETEAEPEPEQDDSTSNSTSTDSGSNSTGTETEQPQESSGNQTSTENESEETSGGNQTSAETEETVEDSGSNSTDTEGSEGTSDESSTEEESSSEESADGAAGQESQDESSEIGEEQAGTGDEPVEEQGASEEGGTEESAQDGSEESSGSEESGSEDPESSDSGEQESSDGGSEESSDSGEGDSGEGAPQ
jgi:hypothetical protein